MAASQKCLVSGSCAPGPVPDGKIRIYSMRFCPYAQRTRLVLHAKGIDHEIVNIHLKDKPEWYLVKNPLGSVPTLETPSGQIVYESVITCEYLDEAYPAKKLFPSDPVTKAHQKMMLDDYTKIFLLFYKLALAQGTKDDVSASEVEVKERLSKMNEALVKSKTKFFAGDSVGMIDYLMWPWFERVEAWGLKHCLDGVTELNNWTSRMLEDPTVKALILSSENHKGFFQSFSDKPNYDYGL